MAAISWPVLTRLLQLLKLRQLGDELRAVGRLHRVLVAHLRHQKLHKHVLVDRVPAAGCVGGGGRDVVAFELNGGRT